MKSLICDFIRANPDWLNILSNSPYNLKIKKEGKYVLFMYNQIASDFYIPLVREARGIIIDMEKIEPVCYAFNKFGNYGEGYIDTIDWNSARVQEKVDGSIVKIWFDEEWHISSNGMINAYDAVLDQSNISIGQIIEDMNFINYNLLDKNYTHIFELVSPYNRVVIDYGTVDLYYLGRRNMITGEEETPIDIGLKIPKTYKLQTLEDCLAAARSLESEDLDNIQHEGFVVVDKDWHRIKIKNPAYVAAHHIRSKQPTFEDIFKIWKDGETSEFLSYYPIHEVIFMFLNDCLLDLNNELSVARTIKSKGRKEYAIEICNGNYRYKSLMFMALDRDIWDARDLIDYDENVIMRNFKKVWNNE